MLVKKAQAGKTVKTTKKVVMPTKKVITPAKKTKTGKKPGPMLIPGVGFPNKFSSETLMAQTGKAVKKTTISKKPGNMLIPGMGVPNKAPKKVETMMAKSGTNLKKKK